MLDTTVSAISDCHGPGPSWPGYSNFKRMCSEWRMAVFEEPASRYILASCVREGEGK